MIVIQVCPTTVQQKKEKVRPNAYLAVRALNSNHAHQDSVKLK